MANTLQKKPFLNYKAQINNLKHKMLIIEDEIAATAILENQAITDLSMGIRTFLKPPSILKGM